MQVLLAKHKADGSFYAVKVLQKKVILKKKEVLAESNVTLCCKEHRSTHTHTCIHKNEVVQFKCSFFPEVTQDR